MQKLQELCHQLQVLNVMHDIQVQLRNESYKSFTNLMIMMISNHGKAISSSSYGSSYYYRQTYQTHNSAFLASICYALESQLNVCLDVEHTQSDMT